MGELTLRPLEIGDVGACADLHLQAFPSFFLSQLGPRFLREFYRGFLGDEDAIAVVAVDPLRGIKGVVVGTFTPAGFFARLLRRRFLGFLVACALAVLRRPSRLPRLFRAVLYRGQVPLEVEGALLSSICVAPETHGEGIGSQLIVAFQTKLRARDSSGHLLTDRDDNEAANHFYRRNGWELAGNFVTREGRPMNCYVFDGEGN